MLWNGLIRILLVALLLGATGCERLGVRLGPAELPPAMPLDQGVRLRRGPAAEDDRMSQRQADDEQRDRLDEKSIIRPYTDWSLLETAADSLGRIGKASVPELLRLLNHENSIVREQAVRILARIGPDAGQAVPALTRLLDDSNDSVRRAAARALGQIGPGADEAVPHLIRVLQAEAKEQADHNSDAGAPDRPRIP